MRKYTLKLEDLLVEFTNEDGDTVIYMNRNNSDSIILTDIEMDTIKYFKKRFKKSNKKINKI